MPEEKNFESKMRVIPEIFIPDSSDNQLIDILVEEYPRFEIFWYHWPHDGDIVSRILVDEEDYEPVVMLYDNKDSFAGLITRRHWKYEDYYLYEGLDTPPKVLFDGEFHPPFPRTNDNAHDFDRKIERLSSSDITPENISSERIHEKFRIGKDHGSNILRRIMDDPVKVAEKLIEEI